MDRMMVGGKFQLYGQKVPVGLAFELVRLVEATSLVAEFWSGLTELRIRRYWYFVAPLLAFLSAFAAPFASHSARVFDWP